jgi:hypothetical protein
MGFGESQSKQALDRESMVEGLPISLLSDSGIHVFFWTWEQSEMTTGNDQLVFLRIYAKVSCHCSIKNSDLARVFQISPGNVGKIPNRANETKSFIARQLRLIDAKEMIFDFSQQKATARDFRKRKIS